MAISFIGSASAGSAANTDTTITLPTGSMLADDLIVVAYAIGDNDSVDQNVAMVTAGYTEVTDLLGNSAGTQDVSFGAYYKFHVADTTAVCDALSAGTDAAVAGVCMVFRGVALVADGGPFEITSTTATGTGFSPDPPSVTGFTESTSWVVIAGADGCLTVGTGQQPGQYTFPTGYTTDTISVSFGDTSDVSIGMSYRSSGISDPEDPDTITHSGTNDTTNYNWCAVTMVLKEAAAAAESAQFHTSYRSIYTGPTTD